MEKKTVLFPALGIGRMRMLHVHKTLGMGRRNTQPFLAQGRAMGDARKNSGARREWGQVLGQGHEQTGHETTQERLQNTRGHLGRQNPNAGLGELSSACLGTDPGTL